jgi:signal transduction histidine kinase
MLRRLHIRLSLLYLLGAAVLVILVGTGTYFLLLRSLLETTDLALRYRMAQEINLLGVNPPHELQIAEQEWSQQYGQSVSLRPTISDEESLGDEGETDNEQDKSSTESSTPTAPIPIGSQETSYVGSLASIFSFKLDAAGSLLTNLNPSPPIQPDLEAVSKALGQGSDLRTIHLAENTPVRLLTYRVPQEQGYIIIQLGSMMSDQAKILQQYVIGILIFGTLTLIVLGMGSWWLAGRSLKPAEKAFSQQQTFVANASHELRAPLTVMRASLEVALRKSNSSEQKDLLGDALIDIDHMNHLVEDLLLLSRLDHKRLTVTKSAVDLPTLFEEIRRQVSPLAEKQSLKFEVKTLPIKAWGDVIRIRQVLIIVLDNAIKNTPSGGAISMETRLRGKQIEILVNDTGRGIPTHELPRVLDRFYKVHKSGSEDRGHGLGLSIAKGLVESMGGKIGLSSQPGKGTRVTIALLRSPE